LKRLQLRARPVEGQRQTFRDAVQLIPPESYQALQALALKPLTLPCHIIDIAEPQLAGRRALAVAKTAIEHGQFAQDDAERPAIKNDVRSREDQEMMLRAQAQQQGSP